MKRTLKIKKNKEKNREYDSFERSRRKNLRTKIKRSRHTDLDYWDR
jgi:hypothetical protein